MKEKFIHTAKCVLLIFLPLISAGFPARLFSLDYVDQRYHVLEDIFIIPPLGNVCWTAMLMAQLISGVYLYFKRRYGFDLVNRIFSCGWILIFWGLPWFFPLNYTILPLYVFCGAWAVGRFGSEAGINWNISRKQALFTAAVVSFIAGILGGLWQVWSFHRLGMQWFDWGHFYEVLINTLKGRFFYLDLEQGYFLATRFCISLLVLLPVAMLRSPEIFLITGALLVASGAFVVVWCAEKLRLPENLALLCGLGFLLFPGTINMLLAQLDGFHEVFLLVPVVFGAWGCYRAGYKKTAILLWIFSLGIRETIGFMWMMWGIILIFDRKTRRDGIILAVFSAIWTILLLTVIMPSISAHSYTHTVFFPHLGNSISEIALSPVLKPQAFWGTLFSFRNFEFWLGLLLPFLFVLCIRPFYLLALLPDLIMLSQDHRFDTQNLLRHYQIVPLMVLVITAVESIAYLYHDPESETAVFLRKFTGKSAADFAAFYLISSSVLLSCCFAQIPLFPASDPRLLEWSDARGVMDEFYNLIPPDTPVTAGPTVASFFAGRNELTVYRGRGKDPENGAVILESFSFAGGENLLRIKLLSSGKWKVVHSAYADNRLIQLFVPLETALSHGPQIPETMKLMDEKTFENWGTDVPLNGAPVSVKGNIAGKNLLLAVKAEDKISTDLAFTVKIRYANGENVEYFRAFGDGVYPAVFTKKGDVWLMAVPLEDKVVRCQVDMDIIYLTAFEHINY